MQRKLLIAGFTFLFILLQTGFYSHSAWSRFGAGDYDLTYFTSEVARKSIVEYGQVPYWNPWSHGGIDFYSNPQTFHFGATYFLNLLFLAPLAFRLNVLLFFCIGFAGMFKLLQKLKRPFWISYFGASIFTFCSYFTWHAISTGHNNSLSILLLPWLIYFYHDFKDRGHRFTPVNFVFPVLIVVQGALSGASYPMVYTPGFLFLYVLADMLSSGQVRLRAIFFFVLVTIIGYGLCMWKLYPALVYVTQQPREFVDLTFVNFFGLLHMVTDRAPNTFNHSLTYWGWWEYGAYFEVIGLIMIVYYRKEIRLSRWWLLLAFLAGWYCMGNFPRTVNPWYFATHYLPVLDSFRSPSRFFIYLVFLMSIWLTAILEKKWNEHPLFRMVMFAWIINLLVLNNSIVKNISNSEHMDSVLSRVAAGTRFSMVSYPDSQIHKGSGVMYANILQNRGVLNAYEPLPLPYDGFSTNRSSQPMALVDTVDASLLKFTPSEFTFLVKNTSGFVVNQNYSEGWHISDGKGFLIERQGRIYVQPATETISIRFRPTALKAGVYLSIPFFLLFLIVWVVAVVTNRHKRMENHGFSAG